MTDADGEVFQHLEYFPFGETWVEESSNTQRTPYLFTGKELDEDTQLYYFGARYYDPRTSVWQSPDPILGKYMGGKPNGGVYSPKNLGLYSYSYNTPVVLSDPDGNNPGLCTEGYYHVIQCFNFETGNKWIDNSVLGVFNQALNLVGSAGNVAFYDPLIAIGGLIEPYSDTIDGVVMSTPIPADDLAKLGTGSARFLTALGQTSKLASASRLAEAARLERPIALGVREHLDGFASLVNGDTYKIWAAENPGRFQPYFLKEMQSGRPAAFNLTGIANPLKAAQRGVNDMGSFTDWELGQIYQNKDWWSRVTFYRDGVKVSNPFE